MMHNTILAPRVYGWCSCIETASSSPSVKTDYDLVHYSFETDWLS